MIDFEIFKLGDDIAHIADNCYDISEYKCIRGVIHSNAKEIGDILSIAAGISDKFNKLIVFGVGGSSLGGQALCALYNNRHPKTGFEVQFCDVIDIDALQSICNAASKRTALLFISKSGATIETIAQLNVIFEVYRASIPNYHENFFILTQKNSDLYNFADNYNLTTILHDPEISGRYSCFVNVALLPAVLCGFDIKTYLNGARDIALNIRKYRESIEFFVIGITKEYASTVIMPYIFKLNIFTEWYSQLLAESLCKNQKGITPIRALGSKDQHNQLQMFLDGKNDKNFTIISCNNTDNDLKFNNNNDYKLLEGKTVHQLQKAQADSVIESLIFYNKEVRRVTLDVLNEYSIGALMAYFTCEILVSARHFGVDPFSNPAVEYGKQKVLLNLLGK